MKKRRWRTAKQQAELNRLIRDQRTDARSQRVIVPRKQKSLRIVEGGAIPRKHQ